MLDALMPLVWASLTFFILVLLQRWIHRHLHGVCMLLLRRPEWAVILYSLVLLPGVFLHELSHWLMATLLFVRTGSFSLIPRRQKDGSIVLGYVEYYKTPSLGPVRESVVGAAPLLAGTAVILLIGYKIFGVTELATAVQSGDLAQILPAAQQMLATSDLLVWLYLLFAISNAMMPSPSDRRAWPGFLLTLTAAGLLLYLLGFSHLIVNSLAQPVATALSYLGAAFTLAIVVNLFFILLLAPLEAVLSRVMGVSVVYGRRP